MAATVAWNRDMMVYGSFTSSNVRECPTSRTMLLLYRIGKWLSRAQPTIKDSVGLFH